MPSLQHPVIGADDIERASTFWCSLLDYVSDPAYASPRWRTLRSATGVGAPLALMSSVTPPRTQPRHHLDLAVHGRTEQSAAEALVVELGGSRVDWQDFPDDPGYYSNDGIPTFDAVRDRIQQQTERASGTALLDAESERADRADRPRSS